MDAAVQCAPAEHPVHYERHRPEQTVLYQLVQEYYPAFKAHLEAQGTGLPRYVEREFEAYLKCGRLEHGFLCVRYDTCHEERLVAFSCKRRGYAELQNMLSKTRPIQGYTAVPEDLRPASAAAYSA